MSVSTLKPSGAEATCPNCQTAGARPGERCSGCRLRLELDRCSIEPWEGHGTCSFVARRTDGTLVAVSPPFRTNDYWEPPQTVATVEARDELVRNLDELGWTPVAESTGGPWFAKRFERLVALDGPEYDVIPTEAFAAATVPATPAARPRRRRGNRLVTAICIAGLIVAGVLCYSILTRGSHAGRPHLVTLAPPTSTPAPAAPKVTSKPKPKPKPAAPVRAHTVKLAVTATRTSWLELRRGSGSGRVLYSGELPAGQSLHFAAPRIWGRFGAAANLAIVADGKRVPLQGTLEHLFTAG